MQGGLANLADQRLVAHAHQMFPLAKVSLEAHALGDLNCSCIKTWVNRVRLYSTCGLIVPTGACSAWPSLKIGSNLRRSALTIYSVGEG